MKFVVLFICFTISIISCNSPGSREAKQDQTPKALEEASPVYELVSKRGSGNLVEELYKELVDKTPELKELEAQVNELSESKSDSLELFNLYDEKSQRYYASARNRVEQMKDTLLRDKMKLLINQSSSRYDMALSKHNRILQAINERHLTLSDLHVVLKISRTLPIIEKYQRDALPSSNPMQGYLNQLENATRLADSLSKK